MSDTELPEGDDRTVLYALPEDQPDSLGEGNKSNPDWAEPVPPGAGESTPDPQVTNEAASEDAPAQSANKGEWEAYAASRGVDTGGMTKQDIIDAVS